MAQVTLPIVTDTSAMTPVLRRIDEVRGRAAGGDQAAIDLSNKVLDLYLADGAVVVETTVRRNGSTTLALLISPSSALLELLGFPPPKKAARGGA